jgi:hypothetical protein
MVGELVSRMSTMIGVPVLHAAIMARLAPTCFRLALPLQWIPASGTLRSYTTLWLAELVAQCICALAQGAQSARNCTDACREKG